MLAIAHHQQGRLAEAESLYKAILLAQPGNADALHYLGVVQIQRGQPAAAVDLIRQAIRLSPNQAAPYSSIGLALRKLGRLHDALASYDRALAIQPGYAEALNNRGNVLLDLNRHEDALASYDRALAVKPDYAEALYHRGNVLIALKRHEDAVASYDRALAIKPGYPDALVNRGNALLELERHTDALASFDRALAIKPDDAGALTNRGSALMDLKRHAEALASYDQALSVKPDTPKALANRGNVLLILRRYEEAAQSYARVLEVAPHYEYAMGNMLRARQHACDWSGYADAAQRIEDAVNNGGRAVSPFAFLAMSGSAAAQLRCARTYVADKHPAAARPLWAGERYKHERIRVAYLSADFRNHATAYLIAGLLEAHDKARFDVIGVSFGPDDKGDMRQRLQSSFQQFIDVRQCSDREVAEMLREREIDLAIDLAGFTQEHRAGILAYRAAPLQINYLGYPGTMGADYIDYIVADRQVIPEDHAAHYSENIVRLPGSYQVNDSKRIITAQTPGRAEAGLPDAGFVFCCFNNSYKITPAVFDVWMRLLSRCESSVLWLFEDNAAASRNLRREAAQRGVAPERLVFARRANLPDHLARHRLADLFLDTLPYNAHTTASDALWAGLPVLTCMGDTFAGRVAGSLLHAIGLPELITCNLMDYEALALELATTPSRLSNIKDRLARNRTIYPLFDTERFRRHIESAYLTMYERHHRGMAPGSFSVEIEQ